MEILEEMCVKLSKMCEACIHCDTDSDHKPCNGCPGKHCALAFEEHPAIKARRELDQVLNCKN